MRGGGFFVYVISVDANRLWCEPTEVVTEPLNRETTLLHVFHS